MVRVALIFTAALAGCGAPNWTPSRSPAVTLLSDQAAAAHECRYSHEVREVGVVPASPAPRGYASTELSEALRIEVSSGPVTYVIRTVASPGVATNRRGEPARRWEVTDGTSTIHLGENVDYALPPRTASDGAGAIVLAFNQTTVEGRRGLFVVLDAGRVAYREQLLFAEDVLALERTDTGWIVIRDQLATRSTVVLALGRDGSRREVARIAGDEYEARSAVVREAHGGVAMAYAQGPTVRFAAHTPEGGGRTIEIDRHNHGSIRPLDLLAVDDGWWLVIARDWSSSHFSWAPPDWRFVHLDLQGRPTARARVRADDRRSYAGRLRVEGGELHARFSLPDAERAVDVAIVPRVPCPRQPFSVCDPRTWAGAGRQPGPWRWDVDYDTSALSLERRDARGELLWTARIPGQRYLSAPLSIGDRVHVMTRDAGVARLVTLDGSEGRQLAVVELRSGLEVGELRSGCLAERDGEPLAGIPTASGLSVHDARGAQLHAIEGGWHECELAVLPDRLVLAAAHIESETSGGPITSVEAFVLSRDARALIAERKPGVTGRGIHAHVDESGVALVWSDLRGWHRTLWRLDREGRPRAAPRYLATIYHFPSERIAETPLGPSLLWSTSTQHGVVPLCHGDSSSPPPR